MKGNAPILIALLCFLLCLVGCAPAEEQAGEEALAEADYVEIPQPGEMVTIPAGTFMLGSNKMPGSPPMAAPAHEIELPEFEIDVYEVTNGQFARFQIESDYEAVGDWRSFYTIGKEDYPVANVTWDDAKAFCEWDGKRLPTEAEWERAARGPEGFAFPWGDVFDYNKANTNEHGVRDTLEVGSMVEDKTGYGLYDTMGNVQEWTSEILAPYPEGKSQGITAYNGNYVAVRGASYAMKGESMRLWTRSGYFANSQFGIGFRCARGGEAEETEEAAQ
jgi:formylglycine-generating enzyme required for sulfatase activity